MLRSSLTESKINLSPVKRRKIRKRLKEERLLNDRAALPVLSREEIISYRLPFHEALMRKLKRNGYQNSAEFIRQLITFQIVYITAAGEESIIWQRPRLMYQQDVLLTLENGLKKAEDAHRAGKQSAEIDELLKLVVKYCFGSENWWWLGHQLLYVATENCEDYERDQGKRKAFTYYTSGRFLFENAKELKIALQHLEAARNISIGKVWDVNEFFEDEHNTLFAEISILIYKIYILQVKDIMYTDTKEAISLCEKARKRALEGCFYEGTIEANLMKGKCQMIQLDTKECIESFQKALDILEHHPNVDLKCETLKDISIAHLKNGTLSNALMYLNLLRDFANDKDKLVYVAEAHKYLGEFYLQEGTARNATEHLTTAVKMFHKLGMIAETVKTRNLSAISVGLELMPIYCDLIRKSDRRFFPDYSSPLKQLIQWKDNRMKFVSNEQTSSISSASYYAMETLSTTGSQSSSKKSETSVIMDYDAYVRSTFPNMTPKVSIPDS